MKIFAFGELTAENIKKICPSATLVKKGYRLKGYTACCNAEGRAYLSAGNSYVTGDLFECSAKELWSLDQWKNVLLLQRKEILDGIFSYFPLYHGEIPEAHSYIDDSAIDAFAARRAACKGLKMADVHLLIPGYYKESLPQDASHAFLGKMLQSNIQKSTMNEYSSDFLKDSSRFALGNIGIVAHDGFVQNAVLTLMYHNKTRLCVADIYIPANLASTHEFLCSFCGDALEVIYQGCHMTLSELCDTVGIKQYGSRRSMFFSYEKLSEELLLNILVNEETPMGKIMGSHFKDIIQNNVAQYDTAEVYVSEATMIEISDKIPDNLFDRIASQAVEIFFVEMLLLQDASVGKMYERVQEEIKKEREAPFRPGAGKIIEELLEESSYALSFTDYQQFYFPTVRVSAWKIAKAFGIDTIREKYDQSKEILEKMIERHNLEIAKSEDKFENQLLLVLAILSGVEPLHIGLNLLLQNEIWSYLLSIVLLTGLWLTFFGLRKAKRKKLQQNAERKANGEFKKRKK